nr:10895_t:CDS:2 [Entrophospora candida]
MTSIAVETSRLAQTLIRYCVENNVPVPRLDYGARNLFILPQSVNLESLQDYNQHHVRDAIVYIKKTSLPTSSASIQTYLHYVLGHLPTFLVFHGNSRGNPSGPKKELFVQLKKARLARKYDEFRTFHNFVLAVADDI